MRGVVSEAGVIINPFVKSCVWRFNFITKDRSFQPILLPPTPVPQIRYNQEIFIMRVTTKGQVTIPKNVREILGIAPETDVDFHEDNGRFYLVKVSKNKPTSKFLKLRGIATAKMSTDEIMNMTRKIK